MPKTTVVTGTATDIGRATVLSGKKIAFIATEGVEQVELIEPRKAVEDAGADTELISIEAGEFQGFNRLDKGDTFIADKAASDANPSDYDGLILPGGVANPDYLRVNEDVLRLVRGFFKLGKPVGVIGHGPWTLIDARVVSGRTITSWPSLETDLRNAGANWVDKEVVVDAGLVSSRRPGELPAFKAKVLEVFAWAPPSMTVS